MKRMKYILSSTAIVLVTVLVMLLPNAYRYYSDRNVTSPQVREIALEQTVHKPTESEMLRLIIDSINNGTSVSVEVMGDKLVTGADGYTADCRKILEEVLGKKEESKLTALLLNKLENSKGIYVRVDKHVMLSGSDIVTTNIVTVRYDQLTICYEEDYRLALDISLTYEADNGLNNGAIESQDNNLYSALYETSAVQDYYHALGLEDHEFECYVYHTGYEDLLSIGVLSLQKETWDIGVVE